MFETLKRLYDNGELSQQGLQNAVTKEWINQTEYDEIIGT